MLAWSYHEYKGWRKLVGLFVQLVTWSKFCHVGIALKINGQTHFIASNPPITDIFELDRSKNIFVIPMGIQDEENILAICQQYVGLRYAYMDCLRCYFGLPARSKDQWQCAFLVAEIFQRLGRNFNLKRLTPGNVVRVAIKSSPSGLYKL